MSASDARSEPCIVALGNSHLDALRFCVSAESSLERYGFHIDYVSTFDPQYQPFWRLEGETWLPHAQFCRDSEALLRRAAPDIVLAFVSGLFQFTHGTYGDPRPFDFVLPEAPELGLREGCEIVPYGLIEETLRNGPQFWSQLLARIVAWSAPAPVYAVSPPPPVADFAPFYDSIKDKADAHGFQPDSVRYKLWRVQIEQERAQAEAAGARFLPSPRQAQTERGLRRVEYANDILHGNTDYGGLLAAQAQVCLQRQREAAAA